MTPYTNSAWPVDVTFAQTPIGFTLVAHDKRSKNFYPAEAEIYADISPTLEGDGDYRIDAVYLQNVHTGLSEQLKGVNESIGKRILQADEKWRKWASAEAVDMMGEAA